MICCQRNNRSSTSNSSSRSPCVGTFYFKGISIFENCNKTRKLENSKNAILLMSNAVWGFETSEIKGPGKEEEKDGGARPLMKERLE